MIIYYWSYLAILVVNQQSHCIKVQQGSNYSLFEFWLTRVLCKINVCNPHPRSYCQELPQCSQNIIFLYLKHLIYVLRVCVVIMKVETCSYKPYKYNIWQNNRCKNALKIPVRLTDTGKHYSWIFLCYAELQFLTLLKDINLFGYKWIICNWITGISLRSYNKNNQSFCWQTI